MLEQKKSPEKEQKSLQENITHSFSKSYISLCLCPPQARLDLTQRQEDPGEWTLNFVPREVCSVTVSARTKMDILPVFYLPDNRAFQPSLQRVQDQPSQG